MYADKLLVAKKTYGGKVIGYVVGWRVRPSRGWWDAYTDDEKKVESGWGFRSIRSGVIFDNQLMAEKFRNRIERERKERMVEFEIITEEKFPNIT